MLSALLRSVIIVCIGISLIACTAKQTLVATGKTCTTDSDCASLNCAAGICEPHGELKKIDLNLLADVRPRTQVVATEQLVQLFGGGSTALASKTLSFSWTLQVPDGSKTRIDNPSVESPTFVADVPGKYVATLVVGDGASVSESKSTIITAYESGTNDVHLIASLYPPLKTGNMRLYLTPKGLLQRKVMDLQIIDGKEYYRIVPSRYGSLGSNPNELPATEEPMLVRASSQSGRRVRASEFWEEVAFVFQPELVITPHALKLGVLTTNWSQTILVINQQRIFVQIAVSVKLAAIESCPMRYRSAYPKCYKIERERRTIYPLHQKENPERFRITEWVVEGVGVVKILRHGIVEEPRDVPDPTEPPPIPPGDNPTPPPPPADDAEPISPETSEPTPTDDDDWISAGISSELIFTEINGVKDGQLPPLNHTLTELSEDKAPKIDGNRDDWAAITPILLDLWGDQSNAATSQPASDLASIVFALDANWLYVLITFHNGAPVPNILYNTRFQVESVSTNESGQGGTNPSLQLVIRSVEGKLDCYVRSYSDTTPHPGEIKAGDDFVELRIPRKGLVQDVFENGPRIVLFHETIEVSTKLRSEDSARLTTVIRVPKL